MTGVGDCVVWVCTSHATPSFLLLFPGPGFVGVDIDVGEGVHVSKGVDSVGGYRRWSLQVVKFCFALKF